MPTVQTAQVPTDIQTFIKTNRPMVVVLSVLLLLLGGVAVGYSFITRPTRTITVIGTGKKAIKPEQAIIAFSLVYENTTQQGAITGGEERFNSLLKNIQPFSITSTDSTPYQITTRNSTAGIVYQYVNAAQITTEAPEKTTDIVRALYNSGVTVVSQPRFVPKDQEAADRELQQLAVQNASERARNMARTAGARLGKVITIQEGVSTGQTGTSVTGSSAESAKADSNSSANEIELQAQVTAVYELW